MRAIMVVSLLLALTGCDRGDRATAEAEQAAHSDTDTSAADNRADNTERNKRDRDPEALTPGDQGENETDRKITQEIRQAIMKQDGLSVNARNVKIITKNGVVTLRGPVNSADEKTTIARLAQGAGGVHHVDDQLEVAAK